MSSNEVHPTFAKGRLGHKRLLNNGCTCYRGPPRPLSRICNLASLTFPGWKTYYGTESLAHKRDCPLFPSSRLTLVRLGIARCAPLLIGAIEASISITRGAGGYSISQNISCARVVPWFAPAFNLVEPIWGGSSTWSAILNRRRSIRHRAHFKRDLNYDLQKIKTLFEQGKASPYDVNGDGNTLLHVSYL